MITGLLITVTVNYLGLRLMNYGLTMIVFFFVWISFREFGEVGLCTYT